MGGHFPFPRWLTWFCRSVNGPISRRQFRLLLVVPLVVGGAVVRFLLGYLIDLHFVDAETAEIIWFFLGVVVLE